MAPNEAIKMQPDSTFSIVALAGLGELPNDFGDLK